MTFSTLLVHLAFAGLGRKRLGVSRVGISVLSCLESAGFEIGAIDISLIDVHIITRMRISLNTRVYSFLFMI